jgi:hypothetical protein
MNSSQHPRAYGYQPGYQSQPSHGHGYYSQHPPKPPTPEDVLHAGSMMVETKYFNFTLRENARGRFLRITELKKGRHSTLIIPASGLQDFQRVLAEMVKDELAAQAAAPAPEPEPGA